MFRNFVHVSKNRLVGAPVHVSEKTVHVSEKTVHVHENCCSRVLRILRYAAFSDYFAKGELINSSNEVMEWEYAAPNTGADQMLNFGCALIDKDK